MLRKYKMMGLAAAASTLLGMGASEAALTLTFFQDSPTVVKATWSGTFDLTGEGPKVGDGVLFDNGQISPGGMVLGLDGAYDRYDFAGVWEPLPGVANMTGGYDGTAFAVFATGSLLVEPGSLGTVYSPKGTFEFAGTLATLGVAGLNNALVYTGMGDVAGNRQIFFTSVSAIPEPASLLGTAGLFAGGLMIRRRSLGIARG